MIILLILSILLLGCSATISVPPSEATPIPIEWYENDEFVTERNVIEFIDSESLIWNIQDNLITERLNISAMVIDSPDIFSPDIFIMKEIDQTVSDTTSMQADNELFFPVLANETWAWTFVFLRDSNAAGFRYTFIGPSEVVSRWGGHASLTSTGSGNSLNTHITDSGDNLKSVTGVGIVTVGDNSGNIQFQFANNSSGTANAIVKKGSYLMAWKLP